MSHQSLHKANDAQLTAKLYGVHKAIVTQNKDVPDEKVRYQVKLVLPDYPGMHETPWARVLTPMAGSGRGAYFLPEVNDPVLVVFEHGDMERPIVIGGLWGERFPTPEKNKAGANNTKLIKSRSGHRVIFDDKSGNEKVTLVDRTRSNKIVLDSKNNSLTLECTGTVTIKASGNVVMEANTLAMTATKSLSLTAGDKLTWKSGGNLTVVASAMLKLDCMQVHLSGPGAASGD